MPPRPIIILAPTRGELLPTVRRLELTPASPVYRGVRRGVPLLAATTGIGRDRTRQAVEQILRHHQPRALLLVGFAGALDPTLATGQVVRVASTLNDRGHRLTLRAAEPPQAASSPDDPIDHDRHATAPPAVTALTVNHVVSTPGMKRDLRRRFLEAALVDMESAALAAFAADRAIPLTILRAVSDAADAALPGELLQCVAPDGSTAPGAVARLLLRRPQLLPAMIRLGITCRTAAANLAASAVQVLDALADQHVAPTGLHDQSVK